ILPLPAEKQIAFLSDMKKEEFEQYHKSLSSTPVVADAFYTRRENLVVFASQRFDEQYQMLFDKTHGDFLDKNYHRETLRQGKLGVCASQGMQDQVAFVSANMAGLLLKTLEFDAERSAVTHDATRQLLYATGTLNKNVVTPEWFQFGVASFFETPQG